MKWNWPGVRTVNLASLIDALMASIVSQCGAGIAGARPAASAASPVKARTATNASAGTFIIGPSPTNGGDPWVMDLLVALVERVRSLFSMTTRSPGALKARLRKAANADRRRMAVTAEM